MRIGIAGTGRMGAAIAQRLSGLGHELTVWNRTPDKARALGLGVSAHPGELAQRSETVISILTDAAAVDAVYEKLLSGDVKGKLFIEMSTVRPDTQKKLAQKVRQKGAAFVECPVGGTVGPAKEGKLFGFAGGEAADVARAKPLLDQMCRRVEHVGPVGAGAAMKLAINLPLMVFWQAFSEALSLCQPLGIDATRLMDIFADTSGGPNMLKTRGKAIASVLSGNDPGPVTFNVDSMRKDMRTMIEEARALGRELPVVERALECFDSAARAGLGEADCAMLPATWVKRSKAK
ncbi:MAG TPA: NAD(P)-dependent oxidoreductase [Burkholderiales bacterium]|nr:NAD(P)-dependent oxidoreductase [Burkholderiales bacterium]